MNIVTYNLRQGGRGARHFETLFDQLKPDLLLLQETIEPTYLPERPQWRIAWSKAEANRVKLTWGSAAMSTEPDAIAIDLPQFKGWVSALELNAFACPDGRVRKLRVFSVHSPSGVGPYAKVVNGILDAIAPLSDGCDVVIGGDFNLTVGARHGSEARETSRADKQIQQRLREEFKLINCWQVANPDQPLAQTLRWARDTAFPYHCDGLFVPDSWASQLRSCSVVSGATWNTLSDHNPVVAEFGMSVQAD